jgi:hypothetical protein
MEADIPISEVVRELMGERGRKERLNLYFAF